MIRALLTVGLLLVVAACGGDEDSPAPEPASPSWAKVAPEQIAEAKKHGVPVAFENDLGMRFVLIPAGTFVMGAPEDEEPRNFGLQEHEEAQHEVTLTRPIYVQLTEVTNQQFRAWKRDQHGSEVSQRVRPAGPAASFSGGRTRRPARCRRDAAAARPPLRPRCGSCGRRGRGGARPAAAGQLTGDPKLSAYAQRTGGRW